MDFKSVIIVFSFLIMRAKGTVPTITLNDGHKMPIIGFDTCCDINKQESLHSVKEAINVGYRHIETSYINENEVEVGLAIEEKMLAGTVHREDVFVTTKLWNTFHSKSRATDGLEMALKKLNLKYIDLMLMHWPMGYFEGTNDVPKNGQNEIIFSNVDYLDTWAALEESVAEGYVKSIGVSNFNSQQLERLISHAKIKPAVNQIESHPRLTQTPLIDLCHKYGVAVIAYTPFGGGNLVQDSTLKNIADSHKKSTSQVMLKYQLQRGVAVISNTIDENGMQKNLNVFDFELTSSQMKQIDDMNLDLRYNKEESAKRHKYYPFSIPF